MPTPQHSPLFIDLLTWIERQLGEPEITPEEAYNRYLAGLLRRIEDHYDKDEE